MKPIIKYISLLLFSGLILPFYNSPGTKKAAVASSVKTISTTNKTRPADTVQIPYFIYQDIAEILFPEHKN